MQRLLVETIFFLKHRNIHHVPFFPFCDCNLLLISEGGEKKVIVIVSLFPLSIFFLSDQFNDLFFHTHI